MGRAVWSRFNEFRPLPDCDYNCLRRGPAGSQRCALRSLGHRDVEFNIAFRRQWPSRSSTLTQAAPDQRPMPTWVPAAFPRNGRSPRSRLSSGSGVQRSATLLSTSIDRKPSILFCGHGILHDPQFGSGTPLNLMSASVKAPVGLSHYLEITIPNKYLPCGSCPRKNSSQDHSIFTVTATTTPTPDTWAMRFRLSSLADYTVHSAKARQTT